MDDRTNTPSVVPIAEWDDFADAIGRHLTADNPLASLAASGVQLAGAVATAFKDAEHLHPPGEELMARLRQVYDVVPASLRIGATPREPPPVQTSGFAFVATADLAVANDVLAELYRVGTIPHELTDDQTKAVIDLTLLRQTCTGVPDDAQLGRLRVPHAPTVAASSITQRHVRLELPFDLPLIASQPARLSGVLHLEVPLDFEVRDSRVKPSLSSPNTTGTLEVGALSTIRPASEQARQTLETEVLASARGALFALTQPDGAPLQFSVSIPVQRSRFPNSTIDITQLAAVTIRQSGRDYLVAGLNVERVREVDPIKLIGQLTPTGASNIRAVIDEEFAADALSSVIASGDLSAFLNRVIHRHSHGLAINPVIVDSGQVSFTDGRLEVTLDCVWSKGCLAGSDLAFTASLYGWPSVDDGKLTITGSTIEFDMDDVDAVICFVSSALGGPLGIVMYTIILGYLESANPNSTELPIPVSEASKPLPGSDKVVDVELAGAVMETDVLTGTGTLALIEDPLRVYAYLRVVERSLTRDELPIAGAEVTLYELDYPPPLGDDVVDPSSYTETTTPKVQITEEILYNPKADELLGTATTGDDGRVTFVVISDMIGGSSTTTRTVQNFRTGQTSVTITDRLVAEALPDLAISVRSVNGTLLAEERQIALNVEHRRFGRFNQPIDVVVQPPLIDPHPGPPPPATTTTVPDVLELGKTVAVALVAAAGLTVETHGSDGPSAWVRSQRPDGGAVVAIGSAVSLTLSTNPRQ